MMGPHMIQQNSIAAVFVLMMGIFAQAADRPADSSTPADSQPPSPAAGPVCISGVYPHLAAFNSVVKDDGQTYGSGGECGIGAVVPWAGKLWVITYPPHAPPAAPTSCMPSTSN